MTVINFHAMNSGQAIDLYERFRQDPASVDAATRSIFDHWHPPDDLLGHYPAAAEDLLPAGQKQNTKQSDEPQSHPAFSDLNKIIAIVNLAQAIRMLGIWRSS
jgi:hypothetical protein